MGSLFLISQILFKFNFLLYILFSWIFKNLECEFFGIFKFENDVSYLI